MLSGGNQKDLLLAIRAELSVWRRYGAWGIERNTNPVLLTPAIPGEAHKYRSIDFIKPSTKVAKKAKENPTFCTFKIKELVKSSYGRSQRNWEETQRLKKS